jgi:3-dehydroquinate dehydratase II
VKLLILNGPNLGRLGKRQPEIYGSMTFEELTQACVKHAKDFNFDAEVKQTDDEATLIKWLHEAADTTTPVIMNPAAFTHYSYAVRDAAAQLTAPLIEVHLSNPAAREEFRHHSVTAGVALGVIAGFGLNSYLLAISAMRNHLDNAK